MNTWITTLAVAATLAGAAHASTAVLGQPAPAFSATDTSGKAVNLADFKGKYVVLEWTNPGCPFVQKHYNSGNMPATQKAAAARGAVWLTVNSTAKTAADYQAPADLDAWMKSKQGVPTATLMDVDGKVGKAYGARTTPHMYVIDPQGKLVYAGAIDSKASANPADIAGSTNYINLVLDEALAGKPLSKPNTQPYGCGIKYS